MSSRRLRILQVGKFYPPYKGGMETHLHTLCVGLHDELDVRVVVANTARETITEIVDAIPVTRLGTLVNLGAAPFTPGLGACIRSSEADIVHLHLPHPTAVLAYIGSRHRGRLIVTYHSDIVRQRVLGLAFRPILHHLLAQTAAIICTSPGYIASSPVLSAHRERCHVLPFAIPTGQFEHPDAEAVRAIRSRYGNRIVLAVGRLVSYKGFEYLIRALSDVDARLVLVGDGPLRASLERLAREAGVSDKVVFLKQVDDVAPYFHAADVFALPSVARSEAFGLVQLEAMTAGIPVVNTQLDSGVPYVSPHGVSGITVPPRDPRALAAAITSLLGNDDLRRHYGEGGRRRVRDHFNVRAMIEQTVRIYRAAMLVPPRHPIAWSGPSTVAGVTVDAAPGDSDRSTAATRSDRMS